MQTQTDTKWVSVSTHYSCCMDPRISCLWLTVHPYTVLIHSRMSCCRWGSRSGSSLTASSQNIVSCKAAAFVWKCLSHVTMRAKLCVWGWILKVWAILSTLTATGALNCSLSCLVLKRVSPPPSSCLYWWRSFCSRSLWPPVKILGYFYSICFKCNTFCLSLQLIISVRQFEWNVMRDVTSGKWENMFFYHLKH